MKILVDEMPKSVAECPCAKYEKRLITLNDNFLEFYICCHPYNTNHTICESVNECCVFRSIKELIP